MTKAKDAKPPRPKRAGPATKTNPTTGAFQISDELWEVLAPLIPQHVNTHVSVGGIGPRRLTGSPGGAPLSEPQQRKVITIWTAPTPLTAAKAGSSVAC